MTLNAKEAIVVSQVYLEFVAEDTARLVGEAHVADLTAELQRSFQILNHGVQTVGNKGDLLVEGSIGGQVGSRDIGESGELALQTVVPLEHTTKKESC